MPLKKTGLYKQIYTVVRQIPAGKVSTYGQIAAIVGRECTAREVGYAMAALKAEDTITPWHRVINAKGQISERGGPGPNIQRELLEGEGVKFKAKERVDFNEVGWHGPDGEWLEAHDFNPAPPLTNFKKGPQLSLF
jgi:methylated-DNA-protein-cysteine methyltransferase-like protein